MEDSVIFAIWRANGTSEPYAYRPTRQHLCALLRCT